MAPSSARLNRFGRIGGDEEERVQQYTPPETTAVSLLPEPPIDDRMIPYLRKYFPDRLPDAGCDIREIDRRIGHAEVVRFIEGLFNRQQEATRTD